MNKTQSKPRGRRLPSLHHLRAFEAAARNGSITLAAEELHVTQSAISHQVKALEAYLGVTLLERRGREIALTAVGRAYYPELEAALDRIMQATERIAYRQPRAELTINVTSSFSSRWLIPRLSSFCKTHPGIDVRLATEEEVLDFNPQIYDASIRCLDDTMLQKLQKRRDWEGVGVVPFLPESKFPVCCPELMRSNPLKKPSDLRNHTLLHSRSYPSAWRDWLAVAGITDVDPEAGVTFDNLHFALQAAACGLGVAIGARPLIQDDLESGKLGIPFPGIESDPKRYFLIFPELAAQKPEIIAFRDWLLAVCEGEAAQPAADAALPAHPKKRARS